MELSATVRNSAGIHCRPSTLIVERVRDYEGLVRVRRGTEECDLRSVLGLLGLQLDCGAKVSIRVDGRDEESLCRELVGLFEKHFDFPPRSAAG